MLPQELDLYRQLLAHHGHAARTGDPVSRATVTTVATRLRALAANPGASTEVRRLLAGAYAYLGDTRSAMEQYRYLLHERGPVERSTRAR